MLVFKPDATPVLEGGPGWRSVLATRTIAVASSLSTFLSGVMLIGLVGFAAFAVGAPHDLEVKLVSAQPQLYFAPIASQRVKSIDVAPETSPTTALVERRSGEPAPTFQKTAAPPAEAPKARAPAALPKQKSDGTQQDPPATPPAPDAWSSAEVMAAREDCARQLAPLSATLEIMPPIKLGQCGTPAPVSMRAIGLSKVLLQPPVITTCRMVVALHQWIDATVQPAAKDVFGSPVIRIIGGPSYACRNRNNQAGGPISEHAFANAIDIAAFMLENGRTITVLNGWGATVRDRKSGSGSSAPKKGVASGQPVLPDCAQAGSASVASPGPPESAAPAASTPSSVATDECQFLHRLHHAACGIFSTVLGPEANEFHRNHFHFDLKVRRSRAFCE